MSEAQQNWVDEIMGEPEPMETPEETVEQAEQASEEIAEQVEQPEQPTEQPQTQNQGETPRVPIYELYQARDRYKEAETKLQMQTDAIQQLRDQIEELRNPATPAPDPEEDPAGYLAHQNEQIAKRQDELDQKLQDQTQQQEVAKKQAEVQGYLQQAEAKFVESQPDFKDALAHVRTQQFNYLTQQGVDQNQAIQQIYQSEFQESVNLLAMGYNPAQVIYQKAVQYGYQPSQQAAQPAEQVDNSQATDEQKEELKNLDDALQAAKGAGNKGGKLDLKQMAAMPDEEFNEAWSEIFPGMKKY